MAEWWCKKLLIGAHAEIELPVSRYASRDTERLTDELEYEAKDLQTFIRDHRSRDGYGISIIREYGFKCQHCGYVYEGEQIPEEPICCSAAVEAYEEKQSA